METRSASLESRRLPGREVGYLEHHARPHEASDMEQEYCAHRNQVKDSHELQHRDCHFIVAPMVLAGRSPR
jgi:hypothetical protein